MPIEFDIGERLWIKDEPGANEFGFVGEMENFLGEQVTIAGKFSPPYFATASSNGYFIKEDGGKYVWDENMFCKENPNAAVEEEKVSFDEFLDSFNVID